MIVILNVIISSVNGLGIFIYSDVFGGFECVCNFFLFDIFDNCDSWCGMFFVFVGGYEWIMDVYVFEFVYLD